MKKYLIAGVAAAGLAVGTSGSAMANHVVTAIFDGPVAVVAHVALSNSNSANRAIGGLTGGGIQGVEYGDYTFEYMAGINSNGFGINAGTGSSQVIVNAAAYIDLSTGDDTDGEDYKAQDAFALVYDAILSNNNNRNVKRGRAGDQGVLYGEDTFESMSGINSNGFGINAGTGSSQVVVNAAATITLSND